jgi:hypothetical protein
MLGAAARNVEFVAVDINPLYTSQAYLSAFDQQEGLDQLSNWAYLTGSTKALLRVSNDYGVGVSSATGGAMIGHLDPAYVIDTKGRVRVGLDLDTGPGTQATKSSTSVVVANAVKSVLQFR